MKTALQAMRKKAGFRSAAAFAEHMGLSMAYACLIVRKKEQSHVNALIDAVCCEK